MSIGARANGVRALAVAAVVLLLPQAARSQVRLGGDLDADSRHVWRGLTRSEGGTAFGSLFASRPLLGLDWSAGLWTAFQFARTAGGALSDVGPGRRAFSELDGWIEGAGHTADLDLRGGLVRYTYPATDSAARRTAADNTTELYARAQLLRLPLTPTVTLWQDVDRVKGAYLEASVAQPLPLIPLIANLDLVVTAGISVSQARSGGGGNAARNGLGYVDFAIAPNIRYHALVLRAAFHYQVNRDSLTRAGGTSPLAPERGHVAWWSLGGGTDVRLPW